MWIFYFIEIFEEKEIETLIWSQTMLQLEVDCEKTHLVCDIIPGLIKDGPSEELWIQRINNMVKIMKAWRLKDRKTNKSWLQRNPPRSKICLLSLSEKSFLILEIENHIMETP